MENSFRDAVKTWPNLLRIAPRPTRPETVPRYALHDPCVNMLHILSDLPITIRCRFPRSRSTACRTCKSTVGHLPASNRHATHRRGSTRTIPTGSAPRFTTRVIAVSPRDLQFTIIPDPTQNQVSLHKLTSPIKRFSRHHRRPDQWRSAHSPAIREPIGNHVHRPPPRTWRTGAAVRCSHCDTICRRDPRFGQSVA